MIHESINYVRRGGSLLVYSLYATQALVQWSPYKIFGDEIRVSQELNYIGLLYIYIHRYLDHRIVRPGR